MHPSFEGIAALSRLGIIKVAGEDAAKFLHAQLTQDFALLAPGEARLAAFCSAKGRMQASFVAVRRRPDEFLLVCQRDVLATSVKRLSMFVLRAIARLSDASEEFHLYGLVGAAAIDGAFAPGASVWSHATRDGRDLVLLPPAEGHSRALMLQPAEDKAAVGAGLDESIWQWLDVRAGIAWVSTAVADAFVPQMLNYESVGGVNFKKGCYPGQEVVARSQFRGTLKRRAYLVHADAAMHIGQEVFDPAEPSQPAGLVAQAAAAPDGGFDAIVSLQTSVAERGALRLSAADGPALTLRALPYPLMIDI